MLHALLRTLVFLVLAAVGVVLLFVAWWVAMLLVLGLVGWYWFRRLFGGAARPRGGPGAGDPGSQSHEAVVIEGEFEVENERGNGHGAPPGALDSPESTGRNRPSH